MTYEKLMELATKYKTNDMINAALRGKKLTAIKRGSKWFILDNGDTDGLYGAAFDTKRAAMRRIEDVYKVAADIREKEGI